MRKGGHRTWSDAPLPLGTIRVHGGKRRIKVNVDGPKSQQWKDYARFWWENFKGPIPPDMRVVPLDGNPLNDSPDNLALMSGGQWLLHLRSVRPGMKQKNRRAASAGTALFNREIAQVRRAQGHWPHGYFFPVNLETRTILNLPRRARWACLAAAPQSSPCEAASCASSRIPTFLSFGPRRTNHVHRREAPQNPRTAS
jgi:hypothetical protein